MAGAGPAGRKLSAYWGVIQRAVTEGATTAQVWDAIRRSAGVAPGESAGIGVRQVTRERSAAVGIRNAQASFAKAEALAERTGTDPALDASHLAAAPWGRELGERAALPMWQVTYELRMSNEAEGQLTKWVSTVLRGDLPPTVGAVREAIDFDGGQMAGTYGNAFEGTGPVQILAI